MAPPELTSIASRFAGGESLDTISPLGSGLINDTYAVTTRRHRRFVLQRINPQVFPAPLRVIANQQALDRHLATKPAAAVKLRTPRLLNADEGRPYVIDSAGDVWRAMQMIEPSRTLAALTSLDQARQVGFALGHFHCLLADMAPDGLHDTLPGFHVTPAYFAEYQVLLAQPPIVADDGDYHACRDFIERHAGLIDSLEAPRQRGELSVRVMHGDPKLNNILFDALGLKAVSLIDLDTVKPGLLHYDIGDCLRSCCHRRDRHRFDLAICQSVLTAYCAETGDSLSPGEREYFYAAIWLIPFELGLRFFSDYLAGDRYFKSTAPRQNLLRARAQFALCEDIARQRSDIERLIAQLPG
ncbi:MAG: aminoglycoside phosphotransferase family protein [Methylomonas sp.]|nr:aminoglycoside phosphotransferase family protein [Methylomonas sp.]PPD24054.1 MAG: aminoglycoside phosphotransferase [Methylomonas sp.]PPD32413.1 MAG: aminoglycoside phosphotransferase [Methylomonas sp.]PPD53181.1 MAG: aminoglycoside phosphotransferase [Methylomonas sp.]